MKQALLLCAGQAKRLRPFSLIRPKAAMPFLNLPLLAPSWLYLEQMGVSRFLLNSCLFPEKLEDTARFLSRSGQKIDIFFENQPLGALGTLRRLKKPLQKEKSFFYINGDSLFFPSREESLKDFEKAFASQDADILFFASKAGPPAAPASRQTTQANSGPDSSSGSLSPLPQTARANPGPDSSSGSLSPLPQTARANLGPDSSSGSLSPRPQTTQAKKATADFSIQSLRPHFPPTKPQPETGFLWANKEKLLKHVGPPRALSQEGPKLEPFYFSGLALFKSHLLDALPSSGRHLFSDFITPLIKKKRFMIFEDKALCFEAGCPASLLQAVKFSLNSLFAPPAKLSENSLRARYVLQSLFRRFDPQDHRVGLENGRLWSKKTGGHWGLLAPESVKGLSFLNLDGPAVIGPSTRLFGKSALDSAVLGAGLCWRGPLFENIVL